jgi:phosphatidylinositol dimannoside acyltransferase
MAKYWAFRIAAAVVPRMPFGVARRLAAALGVAIWALAGSARRRAERNLAHLPGLAAEPERRRHAARGVFVTMALNYLDFLRGHRLSDAELKANWSIENQDAFDAAMAQGRGLILISGHFGNFEFAASRLGAMGYRLIIPAERMRPEALYQLFRRLREHHGLRIVPADSRESLRELLDALKRNEVVMFMADRYVDGSSVEVPFFGEPARLPTAPMALALKSGAPVMTAYSWREGAGHSHGIFIPLDVGNAQPRTSESRPATSGDERAAATATRARARGSDATVRAIGVFVTQLERQIESHPEQWVSALLHVWKEG